MYALSVQNIPEGKEWLCEVKFDGYRCLAGRDSKAVRLWSRGGKALRQSFQSLPVRVSDSHPAPYWTANCVDEQGRISFNLLQHYRSKAEALLFYAFDVLMCRGISLPATLEASPADLVRAVREFGFEGIVAKRKDSLYESGKRSGAWVKCSISV